MVNQPGVPTKTVAWCVGNGIKDASLGIAACKSQFRNMNKERHKKASLGEDEQRAGKCGLCALKSCHEPIT